MAYLKPPNCSWQLFSTENPQKTSFFWVWGCSGVMRGSPATPLNSATLWGSCCLKTTFVVFVAKNCWFYRNLKKIGTTNENWIVRHWGGINLLPQRPPPICCQFVILLKSYSLQHMWTSKSIFKICQKSRFFENLRIVDGCWFELSTWVHDAIFDAGSNIASLLLIFNKNVVFQQQMLIFQGSVHSFK